MECAKRFVIGMRNLFIDLRLISMLMVIWLTIVLLIMVEIGVFANSKFVAFGPRKELSFMHVSVDTPYKYGMLVIMIIIHTVVSDFISDSLNPHLLNALQNTSSRYIPHKPHVYYTVTTIYAFYCGISQLFIIFIAFAQLDLLIVRLLSDILANLLTTSLYLQDKTHDPQKFNQIVEEEMDIMMMLHPQGKNDNNNDDDTTTNNHHFNKNKFNNNDTAAHVGSNVTNTTAITLLTTTNDQHKSHKTENNNYNEIVA